MSFLAFDSSNTFFFQMMENKTIKGRQLQIMDIILWLSLETYLPYNIFFNLPAPPRISRRLVGLQFQCHSKQHARAVTTESERECITPHLLNLIYRLVFLLLCSWLNTFKIDEGCHRHCFFFFFRADTWRQCFATERSFIACFL